LKSRPAIIAVGGALVVVGFAYYCVRRTTDFRQPVRVARTTFQARMLENIFNEISERSGIPISWVDNESAVAESLRSHRVDMWPAAEVRPGLDGEFYVSDQWTSVEMAILSRADVAAYVAGKRVSFNGNSFTAEDIRRTLPGSIPVPVAGPV